MSYIARGTKPQAAAGFQACFDMSGAVEWEKLSQFVPKFGLLATCMQDRVYHAEGDVLTHCKMVLAELALNPDFMALPAQHRLPLLLAVAFHDIEKPATRTEEYDMHEKRTRVRHAHHARKGALTAFKELWIHGMDLPTRLDVYAAIAWHQKVFHINYKDDLKAQAIHFSILGKWRQLLMLAFADNKGRISPNTDETHMTLQILAEQLAEWDLLDKPFPFFNAASRFHFLQQSGRSEWSQLPQPEGSRVIVVSGLPGAGKTTYASQNFPNYKLISFDDERKRLKLTPQESGKAVVAAYDKARDCLRNKQNFVWANTNLTSLNRQRLIRLACDYHAHVEIHALDVPLPTLLHQNRQRADHVAEAVIDSMIDKWEPPQADEAHEVKWIKQGQ